MKNVTNEQSQLGYFNLKMSFKKIDLHVDEFSLHRIFF